jgi:hypothetical protein
MEEPKPLAIFSVKQRPFEISLMVVSTIIGVRGLFRTNTESILYKTVGSWDNLWSVGLILGGVLCLVAITLKLPNNLLWERVGICLLVTVFTSYLITSVVATGNFDFNYSWIALIVSLGGIGRIVQITMDLRQLKRIVDLQRRVNDDS